MDIRKKFFPQRMLGHWNGLSRKAVIALTDRVQEAFEQYSWARGVTLGSGAVQGQGSVIFVGPFQLSIFCVISLQSVGVTCPSWVLS